MAEDLFKIVKKEVDARLVGKRIMGEPVKISGNEHFWNSLNKDERTPSLGANHDLISDFSMNDEMGTGLDVCDFIVYYNNKYKHIVADKEISQYEALVWLVNEFNLDIEISNYSNNLNSPLLLKANEIHTIKTYSLEPTTQKPAYGIATKFDTVPFNKKPNGDEVGQIKNRIDTIKGCEYTLEQLKDKLISGYTCIPSGIKSKNDWVDEESVLQIFMVDIDNKEIIDGVEHKYTFNDEKHVTVDKIQKHCEQENLRPNFIYYTFSHSEEQHRFRLVFILYTPIRRKEEIEGVYTFLKEKFKDFNIDNSATDIARIFYGGKSIAYENPDNTYYTIKEETQNIEIHKPSILEKILKNTNYSLNYGNLYCQDNKKNVKKISNFIPYVEEKLTYSNGKDINTFYKMRCQLLDKTYIELQPLTIDTSQYSKFDFLLVSPWEKFIKIPYPQTQNLGRLKYVMQLINSIVMKEKNIYSHTGLREINGELCYLYHRRNYRQC